MHPRPAGRPGHLPDLQRIITKRQHQLFLFLPPLSIVGSSSRGYISFLLLVQWAYLVLIPGFVTPIPAPSLLPAYAATRALSEQVAFKRAALQSASDAFRQLKTDSSIAQLAAQAIGLPPEAYGELTLPEQQQAARTFIVARWASLSKGWGAQSDFDASLSCPPFPDCSQSIHVSDDAPDRQVLSLDNNIQASISHRSLNLIISSNLPPGDVDS